MISEDTVRHVARLARINLSEEEVKKFSEELSKVVDSFKILDEVRIKEVEPSFHPIKTVNVLREDIAEKGLDKKEVLEQAVHVEDGFIKAPRIT